MTLTPRSVVNCFVCVEPGGPELIEQKLTELMARVERLEERLKPVAKTTWREVMGTSNGDEIDREAARLGTEWRLSEGKVG